MRERERETEKKKKKMGNEIVNTENGSEIDSKIKRRGGR